MMTTDDHKSPSKKNSTSASAIVAPPPMITRPSATSSVETVLKCPRCDSPNTKFCYYNNYSLTQPRHFCKTCRRYWTKGGALRNVPVGGGCRKSNKKSKSSSLLQPQFDYVLPPYYPPMIIPGGDDMVISRHRGGRGADMASSIESLSSMNQDLHWKLQQQRLQEMLFGQAGQNQILPSHSQHGADGEDASSSSKKKKMSRVENDDNTTTAWFLDVPNIIHNTATNNNNVATDWNIGIPAWNNIDMHQFNSLP